MFDFIKFIYFFLFSLEHSILLCMIEYIYTGKLYLDPDLVMDLSDLEKEDIILALLQAETFLQVKKG